MVWLRTGSPSTLWQGRLTFVDDCLTRRPRLPTRAGALAACFVLTSGSVALAGQYDGPAGLIAPNVHIAGVDVSGLTGSGARQRVIAQHIRPRTRALQLSFRGKGLSIDPVTAGYRVRIEPALRAALAVGRTRPFVATRIRLDERVDRSRLAALINVRAARVATAPIDARVAIVRGTPKVTRFRFGYAVNESEAVGRLAKGLLARRLARYPLPVTRVAPTVSRIGSVVVVDRSRFRLRVFVGERRLRSFTVAIGQATYPTPGGAFRIIQKQVNPTWFPPSSPWAKGLGPIPAGPGNPLGTRWMGTSAPAIGIHGTPAPWSLGTRASHGCIRMAIRDAEYVYGNVEIGTPVFIL